MGDRVGELDLQAADGSKLIGVSWVLEVVVDESAPLEDQVFAFPVRSRLEVVTYKDADVGPRLELRHRLRGLRLGKEVHGAPKRKTWFRKASASMSTTPRGIPICHLCMSHEAPVADGEGPKT